MSNRSWAACGVAEHLEVDDARKPSSAQAVAAAPLKLQSPDGGDARGETLARSQPGDVLHVLEVDARLALDVEADPVAEVGSPSPKPA